MPISWRAQTDCTSQVPLLPFSMHAEQLLCHFTGVKGKNGAGLEHCRKMGPEEVGQGQGRLQKIAEMSPVLQVKQISHFLGTMTYCSCY